MRCVDDRFLGVIGFCQKIQNIALNLHCDLFYPYRVAKSFEALKLLPYFRSTSQFQRYILTTRVVCLGQMFRTLCEKSYSRLAGEALAAQLFLMMLDVLRFPAFIIFWPGIK